MTPPVFAGLRGIPVVTLKGPILRISPDPSVPDLWAGGRVTPRRGDEGSGTRVLAIFGFKFARPGESPGSEFSCWVPMISRGSHFRRRPPTPLWACDPQCFSFRLVRRCAGF